MRMLGRIVPVVGFASLIAGCDRPGPVQPNVSPSVASTEARFDALSGGKPEIDPTYANGQTVYMIGPHMIVNARETQPRLYERALELYLVVYPQEGLPTPSSPPITLPSGYQPQCNPCFHPGLPAPFVFHDHVITGAPGMGLSGTAGEMMAPWKLILLMYKPEYVASPTFTPIKSEAELDAAFAELADGGAVLMPLGAYGFSRKFGWTNDRFGVSWQLNLQ